MTPTAREQKFWKWFEANQDEFFDFEADREKAFDRLHRQLCKVHPNLTFEFGPPDDQREFVISAGGIREAFPAVTALVAAAPKLDRWHITGFRPRRNILPRIQIGETCVDPADVQFSLLTRGSEIGLRIFIPGYTDTDTTLKQIGYLMLDEALGEYDVETRIGLITFLPPESTHDETRYPLSELAALFDRLVTRLDGEPRRV